MMSVRLQIGIILAMLFVGGGIFHLLRKKRIDFRYALGWLFVDVCIMVLALFPKLLTRLSAVLGIASPVNMVLFVGLCLALVIIFSLSMSVSRLSERVRKLSQEIAIIRKDMYDGDNSVRAEIEKRNEETK